jgi:N-acetylglucosaminyldiphosphoundecaprenol N-acetyl-beta-D-mannosaminyltransferase
MVLARDITFEEPRSGEVPTADILGVRVSAIDMRMALRTIDEWVSLRQQRYVCVATVHSVMGAQEDPGFRTILNSAGLVTPDGMPLVWLCRRRGFPRTDRVYGPDLMLAACEAFLRRGTRHFFYGGAPGVPEELTERLRSRFPDLVVAGSYSPPFRPLTPDEDDEVTDGINATNPDIVWVGIGNPRQEYWIAEHVGRLSAPVLIGVGAAFDFHAGVKKQAPRWMQRNGLEWLFRLAAEPRRLWRRYLVYNTWFVGLLLLEASKQRARREG